MGGYTILCKMASRSKVKITSEPNGQTGAVLRGQGAAPHVKRLAPLCMAPTAPSKVNDAGILLNYVVIASNVHV